MASLLEINNKKSHLELVISESSKNENFKKILKFAISFIAILNDYP